MCGHFSSSQFKKCITEKLNNCSFSYVKIELFSEVYDVRQPVEFPFRFFRDSLYHGLQYVLVSLGDARLYRSTDLGNVANLNRFGSGALISGNPINKLKRKGG